MSENEIDIGRHIVPKSDQLNAEDFTAGPRVVTIRRIAERGTKDQPIDIHLEEYDRPWRPCKTTMRVLVRGWGSKPSQWVGRQVRLWNDPSVTWAGAEVGGIRINGMSDLSEDDAQGFVYSAAKSNKARAPQEVRHLKQRAVTRQEDPPLESSAVDVTDLVAKGNLAAQQGSATLGGWWNDQLQKEQRLALKGHLAAWKTTAAEADAKGAPTDPHPFDGGQPRDREPGEEG